MIGKVNYKAGSLIQLEKESQLPSIGSESVIYYVREENSFYTYNKTENSYARLKTRPTTWYIKTTLTLEEEVGKETRVPINAVSNLEPGEIAELDIGDMIYDSYGAIGVVIEANPNVNYVLVRTLDSSVSKRTTYSDGSWEMWLSKKDGNGHYYWDINTNILTYDGMNQDINSPIVWETSSVVGGAVNYTITGGTKTGTRRVLAWDSGSPGVGTLRLYYTKDKSDNSVDELEEVATLRDVYSILSSESGIYCGYSNTLTQLNNNEIEGFPGGHTLSNNDWAYVMHYDENSSIYVTGKNYKAGDIIEYNGLLYKASKSFTSTSWSTDINNVLNWDGDTWSFIYRKNIGWTKGTKIDSDNYEPDEVRLTKTLNNKMTIKAGGVDTQSIANSAVTTAKINNSAVTTAKIANGNVTRAKLDSDLTNIISKGDTMWYSGNLIVSTTQPAAPSTGYILWINANPNSI